VVLARRQQGLLVQQAVDAHEARDEAVRPQRLGLRRRRSGRTTREHPREIWHNLFAGAGAAVRDGADAPAAVARTLQLSIFLTSVAPSTSSGTCSRCSTPSRPARSHIERRGLQLVGGHPSSGGA
jgi:hypothetical protein